MQSTLHSNDTESLKEAHAICRHKLTRLRNSLIRETRDEEKFRLENIIRETEIECQGLESSYRETLIQTMSSELKILLLNLNPMDDILQQAFISSENELQRFRKVEYKPLLLLDCILESLLDPPRLSNGKYPLLHFAAQVASKLDHADVLLAWLKKTADALNLPKEIRESLARSIRKTEALETNQRHILVEIRPEGRPVTSYIIQAWFTDDKGQGPKLLRQSFSSNELSEHMPLLLKQVLGHPLVWETNRHCADRL